MRSSRNIVAMALIGLAAACVTHDPSQRFANAMQNQVGKKIDDPSALRNRGDDFRGTTRRLSNGNSEEQLVFNSRCAVYFEIDRDKRVITKWRLDPKRDECETPP